MPAGKSSDSRGMMAALITFVVLFLIAAVTAFIMYTKHEDQRVLKENAEKARNEVITSSEYAKRSETIGKPKNQSYAALLIDCVTRLDQIITGNSTETSAMTKVENINRKINDLNSKVLGQDASALFGKDGINLLQTINDLKTKVDLERETNQFLQTKLDELQDDFKVVMEASEEKDKKLQTDLDYFQKKADDIQAEYDDIEMMMEKSTDEQVQVYKERLAAANQTLEQVTIELNDTKKSLEEISTELSTALAQIEAIKPQPDREVAAFDQDAKVTSVDLETGLIYLNVGSDDHVYPGLTFVVFDKSNPRPKDGKGKAEIEVFKLGNNVSAARVVTSDPRKPIAQNDIAVNLIWNSKTSNKFVVVGEFDFDNDGRIDKDGYKKVVRLIERWGGTVSDEVSINTDFVVLGTAPSVPAKPTLEQMEYDPTVEAKYNKAVKERDLYDEVNNRADKLAVPKFNKTRFFDLIGYNRTAERSTPF